MSPPIRRPRKTAQGNLPQAWRSSFAKYGPAPVHPDGNKHFPEYAQLLAMHSVAAGKVCLVRRIEASPTLAFISEDETRYRLPVIPEQAEELQDQTVPPECRWRWRWLFSHAEASHQTFNFGPGDIFSVPIPGEILSALPGTGTLHDYHGEPQTLHGAFSALCQHGTDTRFYVEGPSIVGLWAIVSGGKLNLNQEQEPIPFGHSMGCLEGIDVDTEAFLRSPVRYLIP